MANRTLLSLAVLLTIIGVTHGLYCTFGADFCDLVQDKRDDFQWSRTSGRTPTPSTGPSSGYGGSGHYAFIESTSKTTGWFWNRKTSPKTGHKARLLTPTLSRNTYCISFAYHMYGRTVGKLNMYTEINGRRSVFWTASGNKGNSWKTYSGRRYVARQAKIGWEAVRGRDDTGDIAIDNISVKPCTLSCGLAKVSSKRPPTGGKSMMVVGGTNATYGQWPWQVSLQYGPTSRRSHRCGGTLISNNIVMTAAHCVKDLTVSRYRVVVGEHILDRTDAYQRMFSVSRITRHPSYRTTGLDNDIALLRLSYRVTYNNYVQPACLPYAFDQQPLGPPCYVTGWGETQGTGNSNILQQAVVPLVPYDECNSRRWYRGTLTRNMMCAGDTRRSVCFGDSGGPLQCPGRDERYTVYGITSWTKLAGDSCTSHPGVFASVSRFIHWIEVNMN